MLSGVVIVALTVAMLWCLTRLVEQKSSIYHYETFYTQKTNVDVFLLGTSHMNRGVYPLELWENDGITAQNFGVSSGDLPLSYWTLINGLDYSSPKLIIIDCYKLLEETAEGNDALVLGGHRYLDSLPLSKNKIKAVWDLAAPGSRMEYLWDFSVYKERWTELTRDDFFPKRNLNVAKGAIYTTTVSAIEKNSVIDVQIPKNESSGVKYLRKMVEKCQDAGLEVLLIYLPFTANERCQTEAKLASVLAEEYSINYINFLEADVVNYRTDFEDIGHLNASGGKKITSYLGKYIKENYSIPDRRNDPAYTEWYDDYAVYMGFKLDNLASQADFKNYLMLLNDTHVSSCVYLAESSLWNVGSIYNDLLANIGIDSGRLVAGGPTLTVVDNEQNEVDYLAYGESAETSFGTVSFALMDGMPKVLVDSAVSMEPVENAVAASMFKNDDTGRVFTPFQFAATESAASVTKIS